MRSERRTDDGAGFFFAVVGAPRRTKKVKLICEDRTFSLVRKCSQGVLLQHDRYR